MKMRKIFALCLACVFVLLAASCGGQKLTREEIVNALPDLVEGSRVLNRIYFGEGFPINPDLDVDPSLGAYYYVNADALGFYSVTEIKEATEQVFTPEYAARLYVAAFDGIATENRVEAARYIEGPLGLMQAMNPSVFTLAERTFDYSTVKIVSDKDNRATVSVETTVGESRETIRLTVVRTQTLDPTATAETYLYRLDSPTY